MSKIDKLFNSLRKEGKTALIPFVIGGDPDLATTRQIILELERKGADLIEVGVPFSDPLADGPTIQKASLRALAQNVSLSDIISLAATLKDEIKIPLVLMTYCNPIYKYGLDNFVNDAVSAGISGVAVPDLTPEEAHSLKKHADSRGLDMIFFLAPTSTEERIKMITRGSKGFIYYVSLTGTTGARKQLSSTLAPSIKKIREYTNKPIAVGFGISTPDQANEVASYADGVIVGSAIVEIIEKNLNSKHIVKTVGEFCSSLKAALEGNPLPG